MTHLDLFTTESTTSRLQELIQISGLIHDLGHSVFSHIFDNYISHEIGIEHHEKRSVSLFKYMVK